MRKSLLAASLLFSTLAQADLLDALQHYDKKDYAKATAEFTELLPLGNEVAAFNLAVMFYKGEGATADPVKALAYFQLAAATASRNTGPDSLPNLGMTEQPE